MLILEITPKGPNATLLAEAHKLHDKGGNAGTSSKLRRTRFDLKSPLTHSSMEITRNEPGERSSATDVTYDCAANPADYLIGYNAFCGRSLVSKVGPMQLALFKCGILELLRSIPESALDSITDDNCRLRIWTVSISFKFSDETEAVEAFQRVHLHSKVVGDFCAPLPTGKGYLKKTPPRVHSDADDRHKFCIDLPFGQARVSLKRDSDHFPKTIKNLKDPEERMRLCAVARCLLCFDIEVDLSKPFYDEDSRGLCRLPTDYREWTVTKLPKDPAEMIWNAFRYELWLSSDLAVDESDVDRSDLSRQQLEALDNYFAGRRVTPNDRMRHDPKEFAEIREVLINKARVDILNPWAVAKLNLCNVLGPQLTWESRFDPGNDPDFAPHTLSKGNVNEAIGEFQTAIKRKLETLADRPNWDE